MKALQSVGVCVALMLSLTLAACTKTAENYIESAKAHQAKGRDREAAIELKHALSAAPDNAEANFVLGRLLAKVGNPIDAEHALNRALKLGKSPNDVLPILGETLLEREKYAETIETLKDTSGLDRQVTAKIVVLRGRAFLGQGSLLEARTQFHLAMKDLPSEAKLGLVRLAIAANDRKGAQSQVDELIAADSKNADAWVAHGDLLRGEGRVEEALAAYRKASESAPDHVIALMSEAVLLMTRDELEAGMKLIERAEKIAPLKPIVEFARGLLAYKEKRYEDARVALQHLLEAIPAHAPALLLAGSLNYSTEQYELAHSSYAAYLANDPGNLYARKMLAATLMAKGQVRLAANVLDPVLAKSQDPELIALAGRAYLAMGRTARATDLLQKAVGLAPKNSNLRTSLGLTYLVAGERAQAIVELERAIALKPDHARPDHSLAMMLIADGQLDRAEKVALAAVERLPDAPEGPMLRGAIQLARKNDAAAKPQFERALALNPTYLPAVEALADIEQRAGRTDALRRRMEDVIARDPKHVSALLVLARLDMERGHGEQSITGVRKVLTEHPRSLQALLMLARIQLGMGKAQDAIATARRASEEHPWDARAVDLLAEAQLASGDVQAAIVTLTRLASMRPSQADPHMRIAAAHATTGDLRSVVSRLQGILRGDPRNVRAQAMLAETFIGMKRTDEALKLARELQSHAPNSPLGYRLEGDVLLATGRPAEAALSFYQRADKLQSSGDLRMRIHHAQTAAGGQPGPTQPLHDWLERNPRDDGVRLYLGDAYNAAGQYKEAVAQYRLLLERSPDDFRVLNNLAWAMQQDGDPGALQYAEKAAKLQPEDPRVLDTLGAILLTQERAPESVQVLLRAIAKAPDNPEIRLHLAEALIKVGDTGRARKELTALLASKKADKETQVARALLAQLGP